MSSEENKAIVQRFVEECVNTRKHRGLATFVATDVVFHDPDPGQAPGIEGIRQAFVWFHSVFPDLHLSVDDLLGEDDRVVCRWIMRGTQQGEIARDRRHRQVDRLEGHRYLSYREWQNRGLVALVRCLRCAATARGRSWPWRSGELSGVTEGVASHVGEPDVHASPGAAASTSPGKQHGDPRQQGETKMDASAPSHHSHLFTVRLWAEVPGNDGHVEWRGKLQHVTSGDVHYFHDWTKLIALLLAMLPEMTSALLPSTDGEGMT